MDPNELEELENLDVDPEATEDMLDSELEESYPEEYNSQNYRKRPTYGKDAYEEAKDENGKYDKKYHANRVEEADEKLKNAKEELKNKNLKDDPTFVGPAKPDGTLREKSKAEHRADKKNVKNAQREKREAERRRFQANVYRLNNIKDKALHPIENTKEAAKEKAKSVAKNAGKKAVKATGKLAATGIKAIITFIASNPIVLGIAALVAVVILFILLFFNTSGDSTPSGYFDTRCDFNLTVIQCSENLTMNLEDYTIEKTKDIINQYTLSEEKIKALMIIIRTNTLAKGEYDSSGDKVITVDDCGSTYEGIDYSVYTDSDLEKYYDEIDNYLYLSETYKSEITNLGSADVLEYNDDIINKLVNSTKTSYSAILEELYPNSDNAEMITTSNNNPFIFVGDSRTVGMQNAVSELKDNTIAKGSMGYDWFVNTAIDSVTKKMTGNESYNIVSWMGVNNLASDGSTWAQTYFDKYKELAQGIWKNHTIYVVKVGPVVDEKTYYVDNDQIDAFNSKIKELINDANINNLKYLDINYSISSYDAEGLHYGTADYQKIYNDIKSKVSGNKTLSTNKALYNMSDYCTYFRYDNQCEAGWWYPIGESGNFEKGAILRGDPELVDTGPDNFGWRNDPINGGRAYHSASDLWANMGMNVIATRSGTVVVAVDGHIDNAGLNDGEGCGNYIKIDHGDGFTSLYCHLKQGSVSKYVSVGMSVSQGQIIALSGNSGRTTGPHLHFGITKDGEVQNPFDYISTSQPRPAGNCRNYEADTAGVCRALKDLGFSDNAVAGLMANIMSEGGVDPTTVVPNDNGGPSYGMIGWHDVFDCNTVDVCDVETKLPTLTCNGSKLKCFCRQNGMEWDTVACQTAYIKQYIDDHANIPGFDAAKEIYGDYSAYDIAVQFSFKLERCSKCSVGVGANRAPGPACYERGSKANEFLPFVRNGCKE